MSIGRGYAAVGEELTSGRSPLARSVRAPMPANDGGIHTDIPGDQPWDICPHTQIGEEPFREAKGLGARTGEFEHLRSLLRDRPSAPECPITGCAGQRWSCRCVSEGAFAGCWAVGSRLSG